jgi:mRNA interferase MazF
LTAGAFRRGDVVWVALDPALGSEIRKTRPAVVVSNDACNRYGARVVVVPVTSNVETLYPGEALVEIRGRKGRVLGDQIRSIDRARLRGRVQRLTGDEMDRVDEALRVTLALHASL